jgi:hypothetical protein
VGRKYDQERKERIKQTAQKPKQKQRGKRASRAA